MQRNMDFSTSGVWVKSGPGPPDENSGERPRERLRRDRKSVRLVACSNCHTQYDVTQVVDDEITCRCGGKIENRPFEGQEVAVHRCGSCGAQISGDAEGCLYCGSEIVRDDAKKMETLAVREGRKRR